MGYSVISAVAHMVEDKSAEISEEKIERHKAICEMVSEGATIRQIANRFQVGPGTILRWATLTPELSEQYARAREAAADMFETEIIEAALSVSPETAAADRVKIDAMKWVAARRAPKKYGDRIQQDHTSSDGSMSPKPTVIELVAPNRDESDH